MKIIEKNKIVLFGVLFALILCAGITAILWGNTQTQTTHANVVNNVQYIDENGVTRTAFEKKSK